MNKYDEFDKEFPAFKGVGSPYPTFDPPNPNRNWIKQFFKDHDKKLVEKVEGLKSVELPDGQIIISKDQVIALIKDTNEVAEEEEENK